MTAIAPSLLDPAILAHTLAAVAALLVGALMFVRRKGTVSHRRTGRIWAALMLTVIGSSFFIRTHGEFSWLHGLSVFSLAMLALAIYHAKRHNIAAHRRTITGLYVGALIVAGFFTLLPSRLLGSLLWHSLG